MTVLLEENAVGESSSAPPRKKLCLSRSGRSKLVRVPHNKAVHVNRSHSNVVAGNDFKENHQKLSISSVKSSDFGGSEEASTSLKNCEEDSGKSGTAMLNGYLPGDSHNKSSTDESPGSDTGVGCSPVATLCNLGNTCFLNSVIYTLRFAPAFLHNLHHLVADLGDLTSKQQQVKVKSSSLGRNVTSSSSGKSWSSKDLLSLGGLGNSGDPLQCKSRIQVATERLHDLYESLHAAEIKENSDPFQPDVFLHALREVNPIFEGNQQHDAHELLVCLLDNIRETCRYLADQHKIASEQRLATNNGLLGDTLDGSVPLHQTSTSNSGKWGVRKSWKRKKVSSSSQKNVAANGLPNGIGPEHSHLMNGGLGTHQSISGISENGQSSNSTCPGDTNKSEPEKSTGKRGTVGYNFVANDFEGVTVLRTTCLECEHTTERKETFCDICVPIMPAEQDSDEGDMPQRVSEVYQAAIVTSEHLRDLNKYWCEQCLRYNEARRCVRYETLPKLLVLQLKRFSSTFGSMVCMSKVNDYMPTPLTLACFCEQCCPLPEDQRPHHYELFGVIMHLGATIASGHYVAYVKASENVCDYYHCDRDKRKSSSLSSASSGNKSGSSSSGDKMGGILKFFRPRSSNSSNSDLSNKQHHSAGNSVYYRHTCRSMDCCGVRLNRSLMNGGDPMIQKSQMNGLDTGISAAVVDTSVPEPVWLECDDETVRLLTRKEFEDVLAPKPSKSSALTPYLLFYSKCP
ncbi:ubiquitin carboxyl-terminal hydrolase 1 [Periplaneta americana]|uniref:ubiquitin carboxyl-terminal hydrolase 1 n=1 Tax=Periplaneta americana TaxID=6978 RepID=UPI0037E94706